MPEIEVGKNKKGEFAILKIKRNEPTYSEEEIIGLGGYKTIGSVHVPSDCEIYCGEIERTRLLEILSENESDINKIKSLLR